MLSLLLCDRVIAVRFTNALNCNFLESPAHDVAAIAENLVLPVSPLPELYCQSMILQLILSTKQLPRFTRGNAMRGVDIEAAFKILLE